MRVTRSKRTVSAVAEVLKRVRVKTEAEEREVVHDAIKKEALVKREGPVTIEKESNQTTHIETAEYAAVQTTGVKRESPSRVKIEAEDSHIPIPTDNGPDLHHHIKRPLSHIKIEVELPNVFAPVAPADSIIGPKGWNNIYNEVVAMRAKFMAPVDTMGCERMPETITPNIKTTNPRIYRFQLLISLMLSSQTKDEVNYDAMVKLQTAYLAKGYADGLCLDAILASTEKEIDSYILKVGFHNRKAVYIKKACELLVSSFDGDIPQTIEEIVTLPGVGPKMGFLLLQKGWNVNTGIGVDVHLHRLAQMWGWVKKSEKPEVTRLDLQKWLPEQYWADINPLLVGFGQVVCPSKLPNCDICSLAAKNLCKGVDRKRLKEGLSEARMLKLQSQRADLSRLISEFTS